MFFKKPRNNYLFIFSLAIFNFLFDEGSQSLNPSGMINQGPPPWIVQYLSTIMIIVIGIYLILHLTLTTFSNLGPKLIKTRHNLIIYAIKSSATLVIVLGDVATLFSTEGNFYSSAFHSSTIYSPFQHYFVHLIFPILGAFLIWNLRNLKVEYEESSAI